MSRLAHFPHPTDTRRKGYSFWRTACGRWAGIAAFWYGESVRDARTVCPKCAVAQLLAEVAEKGAA